MRRSANREPLRRSRNWTRRGAHRASSRRLPIERRAHSERERTPALSLARIGDRMSMSVHARSVPRHRARMSRCDPSPATVTPDAPDTRARSGGRRRRRTTAQAKRRVRLPPRSGRALRSPHDRSGTCVPSVLPPRSGRDMRSPDMEHGRLLLPGSRRSLTARRPPCSLPFGPMGGPWR